MAPKEIKERIFDLLSICAGQEIRLDGKDITALKGAFHELCKLEKIEQIHKQWFNPLTSAQAFEQISEVLKHE